MAAKLQCEICGGKLIGRPGGIFECDSCGVEYDTAWAKQKIQEIRGTVTVEGTVEVQGTVKVDSQANKEALLRRGMLALEEEKWEDARDFFDQALNFDAEYAEAYLGLAMVEGRIKDREAYTKAYFDPYSDICDSLNIERAKKYAKGELLQDFIVLDEKRKEIIAPVRRRDKQLIDSFLELRNQPTRMMLRDHFGDIYGLKSDGTILLCRSDSFSGTIRKDCKIDETRKASDWYDIISFSMSSSHILGLRSDGTVLAEGDNSCGQCNVSSWSAVASVYAHDGYSCGIKKDGTVVVAGIIQIRDCDTVKWSDIVKIYPAKINSDTVIIGLKKNGTVVIAGNNQIRECDVETWTEIVDIFPLSDTLIIGLKKDGSVVASGKYCDSYNKENLKKILDWKDIDTIIGSSFGISGNLYAGIKNNGAWSYWADKPDFYMDRVIKPGKLLVKTSGSGSVNATWFALWSDRTVTGNEFYLESVIDIIWVPNGFCGLLSDGRVVLYNQWSKKFDDRVSQWTNVLHIFSGTGNNNYNEIYGLCKDGTILTTDEKKRAELAKWRLFDNYETIEIERQTLLSQKTKERKTAFKLAEAERKAAAEKAEANRKVRAKALEEEKVALQKELADLKGMFSGRRRKEIEARLLEITQEMYSLV